MKRQANNFTKNAPHLSALSLAIRAMALSALGIARRDDYRQRTRAIRGAAAHPCTLREAVLSINARESLWRLHADTGAAFGTNDTINFSGVSLVQLDGNGWGELDINSGQDLTINGSGVGGVTIQLTSGSVSVLRREPNVAANLTLTGLTITGGNAAGSGGGVYIPYNSNKTLTLNNCIITGNTAAGSGGGIYTSYAVLNQTSVTNNIANGTITTDGRQGWGGGLFVWDSATIANSTISGNHSAGVGGGIYAYSPTITDSLITGNSTTAGNGGGLHGFGGKRVATLTNSIVSNNRVNAANHYNGGGIWFQGNQSA